MGMSTKASGIKKSDMVKEPITMRKYPNWQNYLIFAVFLYKMLKLVFSKSTSKFTGTWKRGKADGPGKLIHENHRYQGNWTEDKPTSVGKFVFDLGVEQHGEYIEGSDI